MLCTQWDRAFLSDWKKWGHSFLFFPTYLLLSWHAHALTKSRISCLRGVVGCVGLSPAHKQLNSTWQVDYFTQRPSQYLKPYCGHVSLLAISPTQQRSVNKLTPNSSVKTEFNLNTKTCDTAVLPPTCVEQTALKWHLTDYLMFVLVFLHISLFWKCGPPFIKLHQNTYKHLHGLMRMTKTMTVLMFYWKWRKWVSVKRTCTTGIISVETHLEVISQKLLQSL